MPETHPLALIVDDEPDLLELLDLTLAGMGVESVCCETVEQARQALLNHAFDLCFTDMRLPDGDGLDLVELICSKYTQTPVAVITAFGSADTAVSALKAGAFDFVAKPLDLTQLRAMVKHALRMGDAVQLSGQTAGSQPGHGDASDAVLAVAEETLLGDSKAMAEVRRKIIKLARSQAPVYVSGESGVGKELAARLMHRLGPRSDGPFVAVNCGAIPAELIESEFFGHRKGAFTGASTDYQGLFRAAEGGTLFLDEVADLPLAMQVKLLRVLQEKAVRPVGETREIPLDVRVISASHKELAKEVAEGRFRQDLYYRVNVIQLPLPPLRDRPEDVVPLARHLLVKLAQQSGTNVFELDATAESALRSYTFPGNVRELENVLERAIALVEGGVVSEQQLLLESGVLGGIEQATTKSPGAQEGDLDGWLATLESAAIKDALARAKYNKTRAAELLGISFRSLRYKIKKLGIED
jgi:two-component system response regulator PilR (NtrC family)